jgi:asparagine synthase (glutamine-hydrolysing)
VTDSLSKDLHTPVLLAYFDISGASAHIEIMSGAQQVWRSGDGGDWVWADGYIANRAEIIGLLGLQGANDDREVLYDLYQRFGVEAANIIAGTIAWALWDSLQQRLVIVRDRVGNHNYYYTSDHRGYWVANRLEALLNIPGLRRTPNPRSVVAQITGLHPLLGETFYESIQELRPGGWMLLQAGKHQEGRYWQVEPQPTLKLGSDEDYAQTLRELLFRLVAEHAPEGQAGITLSSGLDSTSVAVALCHSAPGTSLNALCWSASELPKADESRYSIEVCHFLDIPFTEIRADHLWPMSHPDGIHTPQMMPFYGYYTELLDETFQAARREGSKVVLSGMSGDHLFGGNVFAYPDLLLTGRWLELARQVRYHLPRSTMKLSLSQVIRRMILAPIRQAYLPGWRGNAAPPAPWLRPSVTELYQTELNRPPERGWMLPGRLGRFHMLGHPSLPRQVEAINRQAERNGVDFRHPLLDHRLIEFALSLPTDQTFRASQRKIIVRNAMRGLLPSSIIDMWDKIIPGAIFHRGLRERERAKAWRLMTDMRAAEMGFVDELILRSAYQDYLDGKTDNTLFWHTLPLEDWLRRWF